MTKVLSRYQIRRELGRGGMGVVYEAYDDRLDRTVAVKVLQQTSDTPERRRRFRQEARAASALNHPNIVTIYDIDSAGDVDYIVMEYVDGTPLNRLISSGPLPVEDVIRYAAAIAEALAAAHEAGIVHRDLKPANVMVRRGGRIKVVDFGLSKVIPHAAAEHSTMTETPGTERGAVLGTGGYMSPEQASGEPVNARADVFSFGVVVYEMLTGRRAFGGDSYWSTLRAVLNDPVLPLDRARPDTPPSLAAIVERCLQKDAGKRFASGGELVAALAPLVAPRRLSARAWVRAHPVAAATVAGVVAVSVTAAGIGLWRWYAERSLLAGLRRIEQLVDRGRYASAFSIARALERRAPDDSRVRRALLDVTIPMNVRTEPPGAELFFKDFGDDEGPWERFGTAPVENTRVPFGAIRWKVEKAGYAPVEARFIWWEGRALRLHKPGDAPEGMVFVPAGPLGGVLNLPNLELPAFWIDKYEVTNREFKRFVDAGGYRDERFWRHPFVRDGVTLSWAQAVVHFRDKTGRPGPATWELGTFPAGQEDYPVGGVSWYEAAAFAAFAGKDLPTVAHWVRATGAGNLRDDILAGHFASDGPLPMQRLRDLGASGTYGMSGNVKEWCVNAVGRQRVMMGGGWNEPMYMATNTDARPPFDRADINGFRTVKYLVPPDASLLAEMPPTREAAIPKPVTDEVFDAYRSIYAYDKTPLDVQSAGVKESDHWRRETVTIAAAYGRDRLIVHLLLPRNTTPPYQAVIYYPGSYAYTLPSSDEIAVPIYYDFIPRSGRVLVHPVYQGTYERRFPENPRGRARRDMIIDTAKDLGRTVDYLETRDDIDSSRLAFYVLSTGMQVVPALAMEPRLKTVIFLSAGFGPGRVRSPPAPEVDPVNFAPRMKLPALLLGGRYDFILPLETAQKPFFALLGAPPSEKKHFVFEAGHIPPRVVMIRETLDWLDKYLGPVGR